MALGIILVLFAIIGAVYGIIKKHNGMTVGSIVLLIVVLALWGYFY